MRSFKIFTHILLLATTPSLFLYPQNQLPKVNYQISEHRHFDETQFSSFDQIMDLLNKLEYDNLEERCTSQDRQKINKFIIHLAKQGVLPGDEATLDRDIALLVQEGSYDKKPSWLDDDDTFSSTPEIEFLKHHHHGKHKHGTKKKVKQFVKDHKKEIIIGAVLVVAIIVVAVVIASTAGTAVAAAGAAGTAVASGSGKEEKNNSEAKKEPAVSLDINTIAVVNESPILKPIIEEHISLFNECMMEDNQQSTFSQGWDDLSFREKAREVGAFLAHQVFDEVSELATIAPQFCEEIKDIRSLIIPCHIPSHNQDLTSPKESFENLVASGHKVIDKVFSTDQAELHTSESKANNAMSSYAIGMIPLPSGILEIFSNTNKLIEAGKVIDRAGFTKAGRNLMKHGYRDGSVFPKPVGNPAQVNAQGQKVLESILNHPEKQLFPTEFDRYGKIVDIYAPGLGGVRYSANGEFIGFLEP